MKANDVSTKGQAAFGIALIAAGMTAGIDGLTINAGHGLEIGMAAAVIYGLGDFGKMLLAVYCGIYGWNKQFTATAWFCIVLSGFVAFTYYADKHGKEMVENRGINAQIERLDAEIADLAAKYKTEDDAYKAEAANGGCKTICAGKKTIAEATEKKLDAKRAERNGMHKVEVSGTALIIESWTGWDKDSISNGLAIASFLFFFLGIEVFVWMIIPGMSCLMAANKRAKKAMPAVDPVTVDVSREETEKEKILAALKAAYLAAEELPSNRELARRFRQPSSTFAGWMKQWQASGELPRAKPTLRVVKSA